MTMVMTTLPSAMLAPIAMYLQTAPVPVTIPFPENSMLPTNIPTQVTSFYIAFTVGTQLFTAPISITGPGPGVVSGMTFGPATPVKGSSKVMASGQPMSRALIDMGFTNGLAIGNGTAMIFPNQGTVHNMSP